MERNRASRFVRNILKAKRLPRNQVAALSGLSNPYIQHLENGQIGNVDRKKLIAFAVALSLRLEEIDEMLTLFDRAGLTEDDIPHFIDPGGKRKITTALLPLQVWFNYELIILVGERVPGRLVIVNDAPTANVMPEGFRSFQSSNQPDPHPIYYTLIEAVGLARRRNFEQLLVNHQVDHFLCRKCLEDYILKSPDPATREWRLKHLALFREFIEKYPSLNVYLTDYCSNFNFTLKIPAGEKDKREKVFFLGKSAHSGFMDGVSQVYGFATESPAVVQNFLLGLNTLRDSLVDDLLARQVLLDYLDRLARHSRSLL